LHGPMSSRSDIVVVGGNMNGLAQALALGGRRCRRPFRVTVVDGQDIPRQVAERRDGRASAITASSRAMFEALGVWETIAPHAEAMREIIVTDAASPGQARPVLLRFPESAQKEIPSAYMAENNCIIAALLEEARQSPEITLRWDTPIRDVHLASGCAIIAFEDGGEIQAPLVVAADGRSSRLRQAAGIGTVGWAYGQVGIVTTVVHELPHHGRAEEHFLPPGPFAILPLPGNRSSIVWNELKADADRIMALTEEGFLEELQRRFGDHLGAIRLDGPRQSYPFGLLLARSFIADRMALVGDAAHVVHPIAGLGFNLGLRDAAALAECTMEAATLGLDIGSTSVLQNYQRWRRFDTVATALTSDGLNRLFANDAPLLRILRDAGLMSVNMLSPLKGFFRREAAGQTGRLPRLMRGEPV